MNAFDIVKTVRLTEKGTRQGEKFNQYPIVADRRVTKPQIRHAVQELFKVKVTKVNTLNVRGKARRQRTAQAGTTMAWKKAFVTLKDGDKITLKVYDDACDPKQGVTAANQVVNDGISFVIGHLCTGPSIPASDVYAEEGIVMISATATAPALTERGLAESQLLVRTGAPAVALAERIGSIYEPIAPGVPVGVRPLSDNFVFWQAIASIAAALSSGLAALALTLASIGVFGVMSTVVGRRIREIGIRMALGAARADVLELVMRKSLRPALAGAAIGLLACVGVGRLLSSLLFGVSPLDPIALAGAMCTVIGAAVLATLIPARRALRDEPMIAPR